MANNFDKYFGNEDKLQHAVMQYVKAQYPKALIAHVPNEGRRTPFERYKVKYLGISKGIPDVLIFNPNKHYNGLAVELKFGNNKMTKHQKEWLNRLNLLNWKTDCCYTFHETKDLIDNYFKDVQS